MRDAMLRSRSRDVGGIPQLHSSPVSSPVGSVLAGGSATSVVVVEEVLAWVGLAVRSASWARSASISFVLLSFGVWSLMG